MNPDAQMDDIQRNTEWLEARQRAVLKRRRTISATRTLIEIRQRLQHEGRNLDRLFRRALGLLLLSLMPLAAPAQPLPMPTMTVDVVDTNTYAPQTANATLQWDRGTNVARYRWTNWNEWTNQTGVTTGTNSAIIMILGTNRAGVRAENPAGVASAWSYITNLAYATNLVGIPTISTRTMARSNGTWSPWLLETNRWFKADSFRREWRLNIVQSNWWGLKKL